MHREPTVTGRKLGLKSMLWTRRKKETSNQKRMKKQEFKKMRRVLGTFRTSLNIRIIGVSEGEEEEQEIENLFEKIIKENIPNLAKEIDFQEVQEAQSPKQVGPKEEHTPRHIIITLPKMKDKERILKAAREKDTVTYKGVPRRLSADSQKKAYRHVGAGKNYSKS